MEEIYDKLYFVLDVVQDLIGSNAVRATKYISPTLVMSATRKRYGGKFLKGNLDIVVKIGRPNYVEREFIKDYKKAGEPFPVKKVQLKAYNPKPNKIKKK